MRMGRLELHEHAATLVPENSASTKNSATSAGPHRYGPSNHKNIVAHPPISRRGLKAGLPKLFQPAADLLNGICGLIDSFLGRDA